MEIKIPLRIDFHKTLGRTRLMLWLFSYYFCLRASDQFTARGVAVNANTDSRRETNFWNDVTRIP